MVEPTGAPGSSYEDALPHMASGDASVPLSSMPEVCTQLGRFSCVYELYLILMHTYAEYYGGIAA